MPPFLRESLRVLVEPTNRTGLAVLAAVLYELTVLAVFDPREALVTAPLAVAIAVMPRRLWLALVLAGLALLVPLVGQRLWPDSWGVPLQAYLPLLAPVAAGAFSAHRRSRFAAVAVAVAAVLLCVLGAAATGSASARPALPIAVMLLVGLPFAAAWAWRRAETRAAIIGAVRPHLPTLAAEGPDFWWTAAGAGVAYVIVVLLDLPRGDIGIALSAVPLMAALPFLRNRPDVSLVLCGAGMVLVGLIAPLSDAVGGGTGLALLAAVPVVFTAASSGSALLQRAAAALVFATAVVAGVLTGSASGALLVLVIGGAVIGAGFVWRRTRTVRHLRVRLTESERRGRTAEQHVVVEQERTQLAREVHDVVAHSLAVVIAQADGARYAAETNPQSVGPALEAIAETARTALGEVRTMLHDLRTSTGGGDLPTVADVPELVEVVRGLGVEVREEVFGEQRALDPVAGQAVYRIVQEALTNALRYGDRDAPVRLETDWGERQVVVTITNAVAAEVAPVLAGGGQGIPGMRERAALAGGECTAGAGTSGAFRVRASVPIPDQADAADAPVAARGDRLDVGGILGLFREPGPAPLPSRA